MISFFLFGMCVVAVTFLVVGPPAVGIAVWGAHAGPRWYVLTALGALLLFGVPAMVLALAAILRPIAAALGVPW